LKNGTPLVSGHSKIVSFAVRFINIYKSVKKSIGEGSRIANPNLQLIALLPR